MGPPRVHVDTGKASGMQNTDSGNVLQDKEVKVNRRTVGIIVGIVALVLASLACGDTTPKVEERKGEAEIAPTTTKAEPTSAPVGSSRSNPAPLGTQVTIDNMTFAIDDVVRPANDIVSAGNMFNPEPDEGNEYVQVTISVSCNKGAEETCLVGPMWDLAVIGSAGIAHDPEWMISGVEGQLEQTEFYGGASVSGSLFFEVKKDETDLVLRYGGFLGTGKAFLALQ